MNDLLVFVGFLFLFYFSLHVIKNRQQKKKYNEKLEKSYAITKVCVGVLAIQAIAFEKGDNGFVIDENAQDKWSIGYIFGFVDHFLQSAKIQINEGISIGVTSMVFISIFGESKGRELFTKCVSSSIEEDTEFKTGTNVGLNEARNWSIGCANNKERNFVYGWSDHVREISKNNNVL